MGFWAFIGLICGLALGIGLALSIVVSKVKESNDMGDSRGGMTDFGASVNMIYSEDDLRKPPASRSGISLLQEHCRKSITQASAGALEDI